jgi:hypothetical protein
MLSYLHQPLIQRHLEPLSNWAGNVIETLSNALLRSQYYWTYAMHSRASSNVAVNGDALRSRFSGLQLALFYPANSLELAAN